MPAANKPKLAQLTTPVTATFPSQLSALSAVSTPLSAVYPFVKMEECGPGPFSAALKTPISPPTAYVDFLKAMSLPLPPREDVSSPTGAGPSANTTTTTTTTSSSSSTHSTTSTTTSTTSSGECTPESAPTTAGSSSTAPQRQRQDSAEYAFPRTAASCKVTTPASALPPPSPFGRLPTSAPVTGTTFPGLHIPVSPAPSTSTAMCHHRNPLDSPMSAHTVATPTTARSPFSARSVGTGRSSHFDWDAALRARAAMENSKASKQAGRTSVRHIREVVTRTVTYTPKMAPAPKGKRRKVE